MPNITANQFRDKWKHNTSKERSVAQEHFIDLCALVAHPTSNEADPSGTRYAFEFGASKQVGGEY